MFFVNSSLNLSIIKTIKMMKILLPLLFIFFFIETYNQNIEVYRNKIPCKTDSCLIDYLNKLAVDSSKINPEFSYQIALKATSLSRKSKYKQGLLHSIYNIAYYYMSQYRSKEAIDLTKIVIDLAKRLDDKLYLAKSYNLLGICISDTGNYKGSLEYYKLSLMYAKQINAFDVSALAYINSGVSYYYLSDYEKSAENYLKSLRIFELQKDTAKTIQVLNNLAAVYSSNKSSKEAIKTIKKSLALALKYPNKLYLADSYNNLFAEYFRLDSLDKAIYYLDKALLIYKKNNDMRNLAMIYNNYSSVYTKKNQLNEALDYAKKALYCIRNTDLTSEEAFYIHTLANTYSQMNNYDLAIKYALESLEKAQKTNNYDIILKCSELLAKTYFQKQQYKEATSYYANYTTLKDSLYKVEFENNIAEMSAKYEVEKKEKELVQKNFEIEKQEKNNKIQRLFRNMLLIGLLSLLLVSLLVYRGYRLKKKANIVILEKNKQLEYANEEINAQKREIEAQRDVVLQQKLHIEMIHKDLKDSINYAERIQRSFLATDTILSKMFTNYFVVFMPKDVVSGDFYWASNDANGDFVLVTADCTGHGVPGAIMSILIIKTLEQAIEKGYTHPSDIFNYTRKQILHRLKYDGSEEGGKDGMDANIISISMNKNKIIYAAANNPIWIYRDENIIELETDRMPVGKHDKENIPFIEYEFEMQKNDIVYTFTDGFADQFGGPKNKKFTYKRLKESIIANANKPMEEQKVIFEQTFKQWKQNEEQIDDVTIIGFRLS